MSIVTILVSILIFGGLVLVHEFGHFITAKKCGVTVEEFSIGMGPLLYTKTKNNTKYSLRLLPIGGFCAMKGEDSGDGEIVVVDGKEKKVYPEGSLNSVSVFKRMLIMASGAAMNFLCALLIFILTYMLIGTDPTTTMRTVYPNTPAAQAGIVSGDTIEEIDGQQITSWDEISATIAASEGEPMTITLKNAQGAEREVQVTALNEDGTYKIGITPEYERNFFKAVLRSFQAIGSFFSATFAILGQLFTGQVGTETLMGPIGVVSFINDYISQGVLVLLNIAASLSLSIGFFNLLPIPALDGSRILFLFIEWMKGSPVDQEKEGMVHFVGFILLMALAVVIAFQDIMKIVT